MIEVELCLIAEVWSLRLSIKLLGIKNSFLQKYKKLGKKSKWNIYSTSKFLCRFWSRRATKQEVYNQITHLYFKHLLNKLKFPFISTWFLKIFFIIVIREVEAGKHPWSWQFPISDSEPATDFRPFFVLTLTYDIYRCRGYLQLRGVTLSCFKGKTWGNLLDQ